MKNISDYPYPLFFHKQISNPTATFLIEIRQRAIDTITFKQPMKTSSILISCKDYDDIGKIISHFFGNTVISFKLIEQLFSDKE